MRQLTILGASVRGAAFSALRAGYAPYAIDLFADRDLAAICPAVKIAQYPQDFSEALAGAPDAPWMYCGGLENYPRLVEQLSAMRPLLGNRGDVLRDVRDPKVLSKAVHEAGFRFPEISTHPKPGGTWLIKPRRSSGGLGIRLATGSSSPGLPRGAYLQRFIEGEAVSAAFVANRAKAKILGVTRQLLGRDFGHSRPFAYVGSTGPLVLSDAKTAELAILGSHLAERLGLRGLFNIDLVHNDEGWWPVEVNPRYSASMEIIERFNNVKVVECHVAACESGRLPDVDSRTMDQCSGKAVVYAPRNATVPPAIDSLAHEWNRASEWPQLSDVPRVGEKVRREQPIVTVFASGVSLEAVEAELRRRVAMVERLLIDL